MLILASIWDEFTVENIMQGLSRVWYACEEWVRNIGPGTLIIGAAVLGAVYYFIVRPR